MRLFSRDDPSSDDELNCGSGGGADTFLPLRIASVFIILVGSTFGALFPVLAKRTRWLDERMPKALFDFVKYFGSGVIIATAFIHLLDPALEELGSPCLSEKWSEYPYALAICLGSIFMIFIVEIVAFRWGTKKLAKLGVGKIANDDHDILAQPQLSALGEKEKSINSGNTDLEINQTPRSLGDIGTNANTHRVQEGERHPHSGEIVDSALSQIVGVLILEFGVILHSLLIGLTLAVDPDFKVLFVVIVFHQTFEGLGVGSRLAHMELPPRFRYVPIWGALLYAITTPIGIAAGLGVRTTYNPGSTTASIVSGILDAFSAGILIYTGMVELLAHEFLFNREMIIGSNGKLAYAIGCMMLGCGIMALLGRWA
ncbi:ZIP transporter family protein [Abortiporus biennis]